MARQSKPTDEKTITIVVELHEFASDPVQYKPYDSVWYPNVKVAVDVPVEYFAKGSTKAKPVLTLEGAAWLMHQFAKAIAALPQS